MLNSGLIPSLQYISWLSESHLLTGRIDDALEHALHALELARDRKERGHQAYALRMLGEIYRYRDLPEVEQAEAYYQQALTLATELGMSPLQAHCHRGLGLLYAETGQQAQARAALSTAMEMYVLWR